MMRFVRTVAETAIFQRYADEVWSEAERHEFITWIATNPTAGDVIPVYIKAKFDKLPTEFLAKLKRGVEDAL